jgi:hypothetical protein
MCILWLNKTKFDQQIFELQSRKSAGITKNGYEYLPRHQGIQ